jgi:hypothetical protein
VWTEHRLFLIVFTPALALRVVTELGYRWQVWFNDSFDYVKYTVAFQLDPTRTSGYSIWLKILEPFRSYALVTILQHLMGLAVAVMVYALARHRFGAPAWLATLAAVPVLYDGFQIELEHLVLSDTPFLFVEMLALTLLLWDNKPGAKLSLRRSAVIGLLIGLGAVFRSIGLPLLAVFAVYMIIQRIGWARVAALIVACVVPVLAYAGLFDVEHGQFAMGDSTGIFLYSRVMTFADCSKISLPADELALCTTTPPDKRPIAQAYIWTSPTPLNRFPPSKFSPLPNQLAENFAIRAIEAQPADYLRAVYDDTWRVFGWKRIVFPNKQTYDEYLFSAQPIPIPTYNKAKLGPYGSYASAYVHGNPNTQVVQPFAGIMKVYQEYVWMPGTVYGLILLGGFAGLVMAWRRVGGEALLPFGISAAMIVVPAATAEFDYRYVLPAMPFACLAVVMAFAPGTRGGSFARRLIEGLRREPVVASAGVGAGGGGAAGGGSVGAGGGGAVASSANGSVSANGSSANGSSANGSGAAGAAGAGDDERDLAPDGA